MKIYDYKDLELPDDWPEYMQDDITDQIDYSSNLSTFYASLGVSLAMIKVDKIFPPPVLLGQATFRDDNGNGILEPGESGSISLTIRNEGKGPAIDFYTSAKLNDVNLDNKIHIEKPKCIKKIKSWQNIQQIISVDASIALPKGKFTVTISGKDKSGNSIAPITLDIQTSDSELAKPERVIPVRKPVANVAHKNIQPVKKAFSIIEILANGSCIINIGQDQGLTDGQILEVFIPFAERIHPATGTIIKTEEKVLGKLIVKNVTANTCRAEVVNFLGEREFTVGDQVRLAQ